MKVEVVDKITKTLSYPYLAINNDNNRIVLFTDVRKGIVLYAGDGDRQMGFYSNDWNMDSYEIYTGSVTLSND